jgi:microsomal dipeptidase-like Zn-dependent dipeptidase
MFTDRIKVNPMELALMTKKKFLVTGLVVVTLLLIFAFVFGPGALERSRNQVDDNTTLQVSDKARALHQSLFIGDWHADSTLWNRDLSKRSSYGHVDIPRLQEGNVALQMFTTVTKSPSGLNYQENSSDAADNITRIAMLQLWPIKTWSSLTERAITQAQKLERLATTDADNFVLVKSRLDLKAFLTKRESNPKLVGGLIGTEGSHALDGSLNNIQRLYDRGFRMMSLHHFFDNELGGSLHGIGKQGLTDFGRQVLAKIIELNIIVDLSHSSEQVVAEALTLSDKPFVVSHTGFKGNCDSPRNISDKLMQAIAKRGGLIAVGYWDAAVCGNQPADVADAIVYGVNLVGAQSVALGSDFDGAVLTSFDTSELVVITDALLKAGLSESQIRGIMGDNMLNFLLDNLPES